MRLSMHVEGLAGLTRAFRQMPADARVAGRAATREGVKESRPIIEAMAPELTGLLKSSIRTTSASSRQLRRLKMSVGAVVGISGSTKKHVDNAVNRRKKQVGKRYTVDGPAYYGKFQEFGWTAPDGSRVPGKYFMTRGFHAAGGAMLARVVREFGPRFDAAVRKRLQRNGVKAR